MSTAKITIDGKEISLEKQTILQAAKQAGIEIPTLCTVDGKTSTEPCEVCVVEIEGSDELVRSCSKEISDGMVITTQSEKLTAHRHKRLARLTPTHFGDCKAPCNLTCPGQLNVQGYIAHVAKGQYEEAVRLIMERNPFPFSVGRVCPRFCETRCRRLLVDEPVSINHLKRFVADWCMKNNIDLKINKETATNKKIAVIGGGPAGLSGAFFLARKGHDITIFEAMPELGGMLRYGIPDYKISKKVLDYEIDTILNLGIENRCGQKWGKDFTLETLKAEGFDSILLTTGAWNSLKLDVPGAENNRVTDAVDVLRKASLGEKVDYGQRAIVFGGNNIAMETARTLLRLKVNEVVVVYPRAQEEMPANQRTIKEAEKEGVQFHLTASPVSISEVNDGLDVEMVRMKLGEPDKRGIRLPVPIEDSNFNQQVDTVVVSLGQSACDGQLAGKALESELQLTPKNNIKSNPRTSLTNIADVYAAGDAANGPRSVIQTVVAARRAAENIHSQVMGVEKVPADNRFNFTRGKNFDSVHTDNFKGIESKLREKMPSRPPEISIQDFDECNLGFTEAMAVSEAKRCLSCGCSAFDRCDLKKLAIDYKADPNKTGMAKIPVYTKDDSHPTISVDLNKCIYCQKCQNSCEYDAIEVKSEGLDDNGAAIGLSLNFKDNCVHCGKCVDNCSTGALNKHDSLVPIVNETVKEVRSTCPYCGAGCQIILRVKGDTIMDVTADPDQAPNYGALCVKGRFGFNFVQHPDRLTKPLIRKNGKLEECTWDEVLDHVAIKFKDIKAMYCSDSIAAFSCARASNEENFLMQKFMRTVIGTNNIDHCARL
jgi:formate dehydrogenase major subunit